MLVKIEYFSPQDRNTRTAKHTATDGAIIAPHKLVRHYAFGVCDFAQVYIDGAWFADFARDVTNPAAWLQVR